MAKGVMNIVKILLVVFNFLFFIIGLCLCAIGGYVLHDYFKHEVDATLKGVPIFIIIVGAFILVVAFFGCCGAWKENHCMIMTFAVIVAIVFIIEVIAAIVAFAYRNKVPGLLEDGFEQTIGEYWTVDNVNKTWNSMQKDLKCCGINGPQTWASYQLNASGTDLPDSCCQTYEDGCGIGKLNAPDVNTTMHPTGCVAALEDKVKSNMKIIGGVALGMAVLELLGVLLACCLARSIKKNYEVV